MKKYIEPEIEVIALGNQDIIVTSGSKEGPLGEEGNVEMQNL